MTTTHPSPTPFLLPLSRVDELPWVPFPGGVGVENKVLFDLDGNVAGLLRLRPGAQEVSHVHLHGEHHLWVLEGTVIVDDTELPARSYAHMPARLLHALKDGGDGSLLLYVFNPAAD